MPARLKLSVSHCGPNRHFHFVGARGKPYHFIKDDQTHTHVLVVDVEEWRANNYAMARDIFSPGNGTVIIPDIIEISDSEPKDDAENKELQGLLEQADEEIANLRKEIEEKDLLIAASGQRIAELTQALPSSDTKDGEPLIVATPEPLQAPAAEPELTRQQKAALTRQRNAAKKAAASSDV
jgi:TPP-dependent indolepyruvate ferredoxin oxidoreductase alpha subunit